MTDTVMQQNVLSSKVDPDMAYGYYSCMRLCL